MRPRSLAEVAGQPHLLGEDSLLPRLVRDDAFWSVILYGPPGCGKTSLAEAMAADAGCRFLRINAVLSNVAELRDILKMARGRPDDRLVLFIDEIHRFNRAQQDLLLPDIEAGNLRLIGATTHNPGFYVIPPLLSRSHLFRLEPLDPDAVEAVLLRSLTDEDRGLGRSTEDVEEGVLRDLARLSDGDLRRALNALETLVAGVGEEACLTRDAVRAFARERQLRYDAGEDEHYDTASAFIKSMRGGDPDAALYWLAKMLDGGEDPRFIARRLVILASEDVGLADARALPLATATFQACEMIGLPECALTLAHCVVYLATAPKSNTTTEALAAARKDLKDNGMMSVPLHLRDAHTRTNKALGQGAGYLYSHLFPEAISGQTYLAEPRQFYTPGPHGEEAMIAERLARWQKLRAERRRENRSD